MLSRLFSKTLGTLLNRSLNLSQSRGLFSINKNPNNMLQKSQDFFSSNRSRVFLRNRAQGVSSNNNNITPDTIKKHIDYIWIISRPFHKFANFVSPYLKLEMTHEHEEKIMNDFCRNGIPVSAVLVYVPMLIVLTAFWVVISWMIQLIFFL